MTGDRFRAGKRLWNAADDATLRRTFPHARTELVAQQLRRTYAATCSRAGKFGLHKSAAYMASPDAYRFRRGQGGGEACRFQKGHVPFNKGLRRPGWAPGRMAETQFKAGARSGKAAEHYMPVGSTRLIEGYVYRKISDVPNVPYTVNWKPEHVLVWTYAHGAVPAGHVVIFKNGDKSDTHLSNLACISRRELMARNSVHNLPKPLAATVQLLGALNRQIRRKTHGEQNRRSA